MASEFCNDHPRKTEGAGNAGATIAPAASHANEESIRVSHHRYTETNQHSLHDGVTAYVRALLGEPGFVATVASRVIPRNLIPASGDQDHTILPSATHITRPLMPSQPSHPAPRFVT